MRRREFITALGGAVVGWPVVAWAQQTPLLIGFLSSRSPSDSSTLVAAFRKGLGEVGYVEGQNIAIEYWPKPAILEGKWAPPRPARVT
jgi:putative ABC transport system substrate-binding protein